MADYHSFPLSPSNQEISKGSKQDQYLSKQRRSIKVLNEYELYVMGDPLELSSSSDDEERQNPQRNLNNLQLPLRKRRRQLVIKTRRRATVGERLREEMNQLKEYWNERQQWVLTLESMLATPFSPDGTGKLAWDLLCMSLIFYEIIAIPLLISFEVTVSDIWDNLVSGVFVADMMVSFNTSYYEKGVLVSRRGRIAIHYLKCWFWIDLLSCFPYEEVAAWAIESDTNSAAIASSLRMLRFARLAKVARLLRLAKLKVLFDRLEELLSLSATVAAIASFLRLNFFVLFWSHWLGCIFHFIAQNEEADRNWLAIYKLDAEPWVARYINSVYWAVTTMNTVGYGDLSPQTPLERLFGVMFLLVATVVFSFTMNTIGAALQAIEDKRQEQRKKLSQINNYMKKMNLDLNLQNRVRKYLSYIWESDNPQTFNLIASQLSQSLKYEFTIFVNGSIISYCPAVYEHFSQPFLKELTQHFQELKVIPDEFVFVEHSAVYQPPKLYFIQDGQVDILLEKAHKTLARLQRGDYFGEVSFFTDMQVTATAKSVHFSELIYISRDDFIQVARKYPKDLVSCGRQLCLGTIL